MPITDEKVFRFSRHRTPPAPIANKNEMKNRISHRRYLPDSLSPTEQDTLEKLVEHCNRKSGLHISLICNRPEPFAGHLTNVRNYLVFAGQAGDVHLEEKCGYYGEQIILAATAMGLGTCWIGGTYDRNTCLTHLSKGERLVCVAAVGYSASTTSPHHPHRSTKSIRALSIGLDDAPAWFGEALAAVQLAPSAMNRQSVCFELLPNGSVRGTATDSEAFSMVDLGIAKLHFELGANGGDWDWGSGGIFRRAIQEKSCGAIVRRSGSSGSEYLLIRHNGGHWSFPKGHVENGESEEQTAYREILEETGLTTEIDSSFRRTVTYSPKNGVMKDVIFFLAHPTGGVEQAQEEEIAQLGWFPYNEAMRIVTFTTDAEILEMAEDFWGKKGQ